MANIHACIWHGFWFWCVLQCAMCVCVFVFMRLFVFVALSWRSVSLLTGWSRALGYTWHRYNILYTHKYLSVSAIISFSCESRTFCALTCSQDRVELIFLSVFVGKWWSRCEWLDDEIQTRRVNVFEVNKNHRVINKEFPNQGIRWFRFVSFTCCIWWNNNRKKQRGKN